MTKDQLEQRLNHLTQRAHTLKVDDQIKALVQSINASLQDRELHLAAINEQLDELENKIIQEARSRLSNEIRASISKIKQAELGAFRPSQFHPFDLLQYNNIADVIDKYENHLRAIMSRHEDLLLRTENIEVNLDQLQIIIQAMNELKEEHALALKSKPQLESIISTTTLREVAANHKGKIELRGYCGRTRLIEYALLGKREHMEILLENGANINAIEDITAWGNTALLWLIANAWAEQALWLIIIGKKYNIDYDIISHGNTALLLAIGKGSTHVTDKGEQIPGAFYQIIIKLIQSGANVNLQNNENGLSPLHLAVLHRDIEVTKMLIQAGANIHAEDKLGRKPLEMLGCSVQDAKAILKKQSRVYTLDEKDWDKRSVAIQQIFSSPQIKSENLLEKEKEEENEGAIHDPYDPSLKNLLIKLIEDVTQAYEKEVISSPKIQMFAAIKESLSKDNSISRDNIKDAARIFFHLALQEQNRWSLFSTTTSGHLIRYYINSDEYSALKDAIFKDMNHHNANIRYRDIRQFVSNPAGDNINTNMNFKPKYSPKLFTNFKANAKSGFDFKCNQAFYKKMIGPKG